MQEEKQETETLQFPGSPKEQYHDNSTAPSSTQNSQETNYHFEAKENHIMNAKPELVIPHDEKSNNEKMNTENNRNLSPIEKSVQKKTDEQAHDSKIRFLQCIIGMKAKLQLQKYGEVVKIEPKSKTENLVDVNLRFKHEKDAVMALKSNDKILLGQQNFALNLTPGFKEYLIKLSSTMKQQSNSQNTVKHNSETPKPEPVIKENPVHNQEEIVKDSIVNTSENELSKPEENKSDEHKKIIIKASVKRKEVPLEIMKPTKSAKSLTKAPLNKKIGSSGLLAPPVVNGPTSQQNQQNRSRTKSISREKEREIIQGKPELKEEGASKANTKRSLSRKSKKLAKRKELRELSQQAKIEQRKESFNREENNKEKSLHIEKKNLESKRNQDKKDSLLVIRKARPDHRDNDKDDHYHHHHHPHPHHRTHERNSWTDDESPCELVCYIIGIPLECDIFSVKDLLQREGFYPHIKMEWKNFEGLDYLKFVFDSKSETQKFLSRPFSLYEIPIIILPKLPNKNPLEMLGYHQLRIESLSGPIETESVYEFLLKFGPVTDFLVLDSMNSPTTFIVTFTNNSSKRTLESYYSRAPAMLTDKYNCERQLRLEFNIKPALVVRKKLNMTIIHQYKEAQRQIQALVKLEDEVGINQAQVKLEDELNINQAPKPNFVMSNFSAQGPMPQISNMISPIPSTRSGSFNYSPQNPGYNQQLNANNMNENPGYFNMQQGGYGYPRQEPTIYSPNQSINSLQNFGANMNNNQDSQRNMLPIYQMPQIPQRFENPSYNAQNQYMGNQMMMPTQAYGMPQVNNAMYGSVPYNDMRTANNYPVNGNPYSFPNQDGRNNVQYFY